MEPLRFFGILNNALQDGEVDSGKVRKRTVGGMPVAWKLDER